MAQTSDHLMDGIDEFIDDLTVLPPSIWDPSTRMEPPQKTISMVGVSAPLQQTVYLTLILEYFHIIKQEDR